MLIFIIEDDPFYAEMLSYQVKQNPDNSTRVFNSGSELLSYNGEKPDAITIDYSLPDYTGLELLKKLNTIYKDVPKIVISSQQEVNKVLELFELGIRDYLIKDNDTKNRLWSILNNISVTKGLKEEVSLLKREIKHSYDNEVKLVGESDNMKQVFCLLNKAYESRINVIVYGETGTGKEVVAKSIHYKSCCANRDFVAVNMAAIPENLIESDLFGHEKGSFTGATMRRKGKFEEANGGTIFLDEIAELDLHLQAKLLRVLQEGEVMPVGGNRKIKLNLRVITATHQDLSRLVQEGKFREDLYYRLMGLQIRLPSLRERGQDILLLANHFLSEYMLLNRTSGLMFSSQASEKLLSYHYPGNIRELRSLVELSAVLSDGKIIEAKDINFYGIDRKKDCELEEKPLKNHCQDIITHFLNKYDDNVVKVSKLLEISKSKIYQMIKEGEL